VDSPEGCGLAFPDVNGWWLPPRGAAVGTTVVTLRYRVELLTPMLGGGVTTKKIDLKRPFRARPILGQIRYWWQRLAVAGCLPEPDGKAATPVSGGALYAKERARFGGVTVEGSAPAPFSIRVSNIADVERWNAKDAKWEFPYALHMVAPRDWDSHADVIRTGATFGLTLVVPKNWAAEYGEAVRWWASFGGVGARTTRGMGAVAVYELRGGQGEPTLLRPVSEDDADKVGAELVVRSSNVDPYQLTVKADATLRAFRQGHDSRRISESVSDQARARRVLSESDLTTPGTDGKSFRDGVKALLVPDLDQSVRPWGTVFWQPPKYGQHSGKVAYRPGRSRWPSADSLRYLANESKGQSHDKSLDIRHRLLSQPTPRPTFANGAFGLPIAGKQLGGNHETAQKYAPAENILKGQGEYSLRLPGGDAMRSPLRIRARRTVDNRTELVALVFRDELEWALKQEVEVVGPVRPQSGANNWILETHSGTYPVWSGDSVERATLRDLIEPMTTHGGGATDPVNAFLHYLKTANL